MRGGGLVQVTIGPNRTDSGDAELLVRSLCAAIERGPTRNGRVRAAAVGELEYHHE